MALLPNKSATGTQKFFGYAILLALVYLAARIIHGVVPPITTALDDLMSFVTAALIPFVLTMILVLNWTPISWAFISFVKGIGNFLIKQDPISMIRRYIDHLEQKLKDLNERITIVSGKKIKIDRKIMELQGKIEHNVRLSIAAKGQGKKEQADVFGTYAQTDKNILENLLPIQAKTDKVLNFLNVIADDARYTTDKLKYQVDAKEQEFETIKETMKGLKSAEDFINSGTEEGQIFAQSLKELEEQATAKLGYIEEFQKRAQPLIDNIEVEKQATRDEGMAFVEKYMAENKGQLDSPKAIQDLEYVDVSTPPVNVPRFNLLRKGGTTIILLVVSLMGISQNFKPYVSAGTNLTNGKLSYGAELGVWNEKVWYAATFSTNTKDSYVGAKGYFLISKQGVFYGYAFVGTSVHLNPDIIAYIEPGFSLNLMTRSRFWPALSLSLPMSNETFKPSISVGASVNYSF